VLPSARCRQSDRLQEEIPTAEYMVSATDKMMTDIIDTLESVSTSQNNMNHIFINFSYVFPLNPWI
jgi:acetyl-CoA carboxylase/biotin carboxylase 1